MYWADGSVCGLQNIKGSHLTCPEHSRESISKEQELNHMFLKRKKIEREILGINERNLSYVYKYNSKEFFELADDKVKCKEVLESKNIACPKTLGVISKMGEIESVWAELQVCDKLVIKPAMGAGGNGIIILRKNDKGQWYSPDGILTAEEIHSHLSCIIMGMFSKSHSDKVLIEEFIESHDFFSNIFPKGVPDIRIILVNDQIVMGMLRLPTKKSGGKANLHQGGLGVGLDLESGQMLQAYDGSTYHNVHPDTGSPIYQKHLPYWERIKEISLQTSIAFPLNYLGVDLILDKKRGPMVMEINVRPGLAIQLANKKGLKSALINTKN